jgi:hypothetical protein
MTYTFKTGTGAMIMVPSFIKIGSDIQKLLVGYHRQHGNLMSLLQFFLNMESKRKKKPTKLRSRSPEADYTDLAIASCRRS